MHIVDTLVLNTTLQCEHNCKGCYVNSAWNNALVKTLSKEETLLPFSGSVIPQDPVGVLSSLIKEDIARTYILCYNPTEPGQDALKIRQMQLPEGDYNLEIILDYRDLEHLYNVSHRPATLNISIPPKLLSYTNLFTLMLPDTLRDFRDSGITPALNIRLGGLLKLSEKELEAFCKTIDSLEGLTDRIYLLWDKPLMSRDKSSIPSASYLPIEYWKMQQRLNKLIKSYLMKDIYIKTDSCLRASYQSMQGKKTNCGAGLDWLNLFAVSPTLWQGCPYSKDFYSVEGNLSYREQAKELKYFFSQGSDFNKACNIKDYIKQGETK